MASGKCHSGLTTRHFIFILVLSFFPGKFIFAGPEITVYDGSVTLSWTAPGDDGYRGQAAEYDIRYSLNEPGNDKELWWNLADTCIGEPVPSEAGSFQYFTISDLDPEEVYYFAIKTADESGNWSSVSNIVDNKFFPCADINDDYRMNIIDIVYILDFLYGDGSQLAPGKGDLNGSGDLNMLDVVFFINYLYKNGPDPACPTQ